MKQLLFSLATILIFVSSDIKSQNVSPIKEGYDKLYFSFSPSNFNYNNCFLTGNSLSWTLSGLLHMYQTTADKAYLVKFINHCIKLQKVRWDEYVSGEAPVWIRIIDDDCDLSPVPNDGEPAYFNSLLIYPMAEFVYMVINDQNLYNTNLPISQFIDQDVIDITVLNTLTTPNAVTMYGDFALWLGKRVEETMIYMENTYETGEGIEAHDGDNVPAGMNMLSPYCTAALFMGYANTDFGNGNLSNGHFIIARTFAENLTTPMELYNDNDCNLNTPQCFTLNVFQDAQSNSYTWYTKELGVGTDFRIECFSQRIKCSTLTEYVEDVGHGAMDLFFIRSCYETGFSPPNSSTPYFTFSQMEKFRNTLTKNIYFTIDTNPHFHNNVDGTDNPSQDLNCNPNCPPDLHKAEVFAWMPLYKFDGSSQPDVYDILLNQALTLLLTPSAIGAESYLGLSEVVKAQWDKECVNLSLYKRDVVYDQDFNVKNSITVEPESTSPNNTSNSFADPIITTPEFIIESNVTSAMTGGEKVELKSGFRAKSGCEFRASIVQNTCSDGNEKIINPDENTTQQTAPMTDKTRKLFSVYPNPSSGEFTISTTEQYFTVTVYDMLGNVIYEGKNDKTLNLSSEPKGIYYLKISTGDKLYSQRLIVQ